MANVHIKLNVDDIADEAAEITAKALNLGIATRNNSNWLLSGGTAPQKAYSLLADKYLNDVDWKKVTVAIGDERCVSFDNPEASWPLIAASLLDKVSIPDDNKIRPKSDDTPKVAATDYEEKLSKLTKKGTVPHFDIVWLGMGEDGHTLSLFPGESEIANSDSLVMPVYNSPKPPPERITLTLKALKDCISCVVMVAGASKANAIGRVLKDDESLPINLAVKTIEDNGGIVTWLIDEAAAANI